MKEKQDLETNSWKLLLDGFKGHFPEKKKVEAERGIDQWGFEVQLTTGEKPKGTFSPGKVLDSQNHVSSGV